MIIAWFSCLDGLSISHPPVCEHKLYSFSISQNRPWSRDQIRTVNQQLDDMNSDEAARCISISREKYRHGNLEAALKFARKSVALNRTTEACDLVARLEAEQKSGGLNGSKQNSTQSSSSEHSQTKANARQKHGNRQSSPEKRESQKSYTADQKA